MTDCSLLQRFQGAFLGSAVLPASPSESPQAILTPLSQTLLDRGQQLQQQASWCPEQFTDDGTELDRLTQGILMSLILHESPLERKQALKAIQASLVLECLSDVLAWRLQNHTVTWETLIERSPAPQTLSPLKATLQNLVWQQIPLTTALDSLIAYPDLDGMDRVIAIALYCWVCTPQHWHISVGRSQQALHYLQAQQSSLVLFQIIPALTGLILGLANGEATIPQDSASLSLAQRQPLLHLANQLYQRWSGLHLGHPNPERLMQSVILHPGGLKPRTSDHLELKKDYNFS